MKSRAKFFHIILLLFTVSTLAQQDGKEMTFVSGEKGRDIIAVAAERYEQGYFSEVISLLTENMATLSRDQKVRAHDWLARACIALDDRTAAAEHVRTMLFMDLNYQPNAQMDPFFNKLVQDIKKEVQQEIQPKRWYQKKWVWATAAAATIVTVLAWPKPEKRTELPGPPGSPEPPNH
ncbi:hypothetical protein EH223_18770 [candidate division KSB1 bacterium]|nr:hypothetical protein [candidate division KSB1 bacterium]RQW00432.1 MAG: hypothetical protein EH223_18770 [candidate division KSB1 bacterium]